MRPLASLLLLALVAAAQPPVVPDFVRMKAFRDEVLTRLAQLKADEEFASKPPEEKMLLAFLNGDKKFGNELLTGKLVVTTCLMKWADVQRAEPTEAGKRVLAKLPEVLSKRYGEAIDVPKDRKDVSKFLLDALDSDFIHVRAAALESLMKMYRTGQAFMYVADMNKKARAEPIKTWRKFVGRQK
jgi:hypothetical protein